MPRASGSSSVALVCRVEWQSTNPAPSAMTAGMDACHVPNASASGTRRPSGSTQADQPTLAEQRPEASNESTGDEDRRSVEHEDEPDAGEPDPVLVVEQRARYPVPPKNAAPSTSTSTYRIIALLFRNSRRWPANGSPEAAVAGTAPRYRQSGTTRAAASAASTRNIARHEIAEATIPRLQRRAPARSRRPQATSRSPAGDGRRRRGSRPWPARAGRTPLPPHP